jgi:hypothetical protein
MLRTAGLFILYIISILWPWAGFASMFWGVEMIMLSAVYLAIGFQKGWLYRGARVAKPETILFYLFVISALLSTILTSDAALDESYLVLKSAGYFLITLTIAGMNVTNGEAKSIIQLFLCSLIAVLALSLASYTGIHIVGGKFSSEYIFDSAGLKGPYQSRTIMSKYISLGLPVVVLAGMTRRVTARIFWLAGTIIVFIASVLTLSRGLYVAVFIVLATLIIPYSSRWSENHSALLSGLVGLCAVAVFIFRSEVSVTVADRLLGTLTVGSDAGGLMTRYRIFKSTLQDLPSHIFGFGFTRVTVHSLDRAFNPHNLLLVMIRGAGVVGVACYLLIVVRSLCGLFRFHFASPQFFLAASLMSWITYGFTHATMNMLMSWVFLGLLISPTIKTKGYT